MRGYYGRLDVRRAARRFVARPHALQRFMATCLSTLLPFTGGWQYEVLIRVNRPTERRGSRGGGITTKIQVVNTLPSLSCCYGSQVLNEMVHRRYGDNHDEGIPLARTSFLLGSFWLMVEAPQNLFCQRFFLSSAASLQKSMKSWLF